jgi:hemerythrin
MGFIEIRPEMITGNKEIDTHHRHLVELFNTFLGAFRMQKHKDQLGSLLEQLVDFATYHFHAEELWMSDCGYPDALAHCQEHETFIKRLSDIQKDFAAERRGVSLEVLQFLSRWLKSHIYGSDIRVARMSSRKG